MNNNEIKIRQLLKKFMDGTTTVDEEQEIGRWFRHHPKVSDDLEDYRMMFSWFDNGMHLDKDNKPVIPADKKEAPRHWLWATIAIAASVALIIGILLPKSTQQKQAARQLAVRTIQNDSTNHNVPSTTERNETQSDTINQKNIFNEKLKEERHKRSRIRFAPVPPPPLYAEVDSTPEIISSEDETLVAKTDNEDNAKLIDDEDNAKLINNETANKIIDSMLASMDKGQQVQLKLLNLINKAQEQNIMATLDDEDVY